MERIKSIDKQLTDIFNGFGNIAAGLQLDPRCLLSEREAIKNHSYSGIYLIEIRVDGAHNTFDSWFAEFQPLWEDEAYKRKFTPNTKKKRVRQHRGRPLGEWIPLYIGKAKNVGARVTEHLELGLNQPTTSLKLDARNNLGERVFRLSTIEVDVVNYDLIMPSIERALRDRFNPILGRQ